MKRIVPLLASLGLLWSGLSAAAPLAPLKLPPPDLVPLLPLAAPPLDKPPVSLPEPPLPAVPGTPGEGAGELPLLPPPPFLVDLSQKPVAPLPPPRILACNPLGTLFEVASELLECGRARFQRGELEEAQSALERAVRAGTGRALVREARYWLGETLARLNRLGEAERALLLVYQDAPTSELAFHALNSLGWLALRLNDPGRALASFERATKASAPPEVIPYASHGRALALYAQQRHAAAREAWQALSTQGVPAALAREVSFWLGETLGRLGEYALAEEHLRRFTAAGPHHLIETGIFRLGWWALAGGRHLESMKAFRWLLSAYPRGSERAWARAGLALALVALDDFHQAREVVHHLQAQDPAHPLVMQSLLLLFRSSVEKAQFALAQSLHEELLALNLPPDTRSYVILLTAEASRRQGRSGEARSQFELVRSTQPGSAFAWRAALRLVQMDLEAREYARALDEVNALLGQPLPPDLRGAALLLRGETAYWGRAYDTAAAAYGRFLAEFQRHPEAGTAALSLGWAEFRRGRADAAQQLWLDFARSYPDDQRAGEALLLAAELAARSGDPGTARDLLTQFLARFPARPDAPVAKLNLAILALRAGQFEQALTWLRELTASASFFIGRVRLATGLALLAAGSPAEAVGEFAEALQQGEDVLAHLGLGNAALAQGQWQTAGRHFAEARALASEPARRLAEYGAAVAALSEGKREEFSRAATVLVQSPPAPSLVPRLAYVLAAVAVEEKRWAEARQWTLKLVNDYPADEAADDALARLGAGAVAVKEWPLVRESYQLLLGRYPESPHTEESRVDLAEALLRTGAAAEARGLIERSFASVTNGPRRTRALRLLAEAQEVTGERPKAIETLARLVAENPGPELLSTARLTRGRLLQEEGRWEESRQMLELVLNDGEAGTRVEAAFRLGEGYRARGSHGEAVEAYMTAAYLAPESAWGRRALLRAGQSFTAMKERNSAAIVYRKLLAQPGVEPELATEAKKALHAFGQRP